MTTVSGNNFTYTGTDLVNCIGSLVQRSGITANSTDTLPTATDIITAFTGENSSSNIGQCFSFSIYNNSVFNITLVSNTGISFVGTVSDDILPQGVRTYTVIQTAISTAVIYIIGNSPVNPDTSNSLYLTNGQIFVGNASNIAISAAISGDATVTNTGVLTLANTAVAPGTYNNTRLTVNSKGLITGVSSSPGLVSQTIVSAITNNSNQTWTADKMLGGIITRNCNGAARTDTTATATLLVNQFTTQFGRAPIVGDTVILLVVNNSTSANTLTIAVGTGVTHIATTQTLTQNAGKNALIRFANVTPGSYAVVMYWDY